VSSGIDHRKTYVKAAAVHAAAAVSRLLEIREPKEVPELRQIPFAQLSDVVFPAGEEVYAVFADLVGAVSGQAGIAVRRDGLRDMLEHLIGGDWKGELDEPSRSALAEVGNIAVSAAAGALGHLAGGVVVPSVPRLGRDLATALAIELPADDLNNLPVFVVDWQHADPVRPLYLSFIWIPAE
jgi:chemotaxis protein CheC